LDALFQSVPSPWYFFFFSVPPFPTAVFYQFSEGLIQGCVSGRTFAVSHGSGLLHPSALLSPIQDTLFFMFNIFFPSLPEEWF